MIPLQNSYEESVGDGYALDTTSWTNYNAFPLPLTLDPSLAFYPLATSSSTNTSKIYYDQSSISVNVTNGEYYQIKF